MIEEIEVGREKSWCMYIAVRHRAQDTKDWGNCQSIQSGTIGNFGIWKLGDWEISSK
jgi:hypothetical protein